MERMGKSDFPKEDLPGLLQPNVEMPYFFHTFIKMHLQVAGGLVSPKDSTAPDHDP